jgi:hypothetical protein
MKKKKVPLEHESRKTCCSDAIGSVHKAKREKKKRETLPSARGLLFGSLHVAFTALRMNECAG